MGASENEIVVGGRRVTREDVLRSIARCEAIGRIRFLAEGGYREAVRWHLRHDGRSYPSKAILGDAAGLRSDEFFGGARGAVQALSRLGFHVRNSETGEIADVRLDSLRRLLEREGLDVRERPWPDSPVAPTAYFASGSNRPAEIRGLGRAGADVGVAVPELSEESIEALLELEGSDVHAFVDSGAFSEVRWNAEVGGFDVVRPMGEREWGRVFDVYRRLAGRLGSQVWIVAPDRVGDQDETLARLSRHRAELGSLAAMGARVLVPIQKGARSQAAFALEVARALEGIDWIPALPCKKAATTPEEVGSFLRATSPRHVHLLGLGIRSRKLEDYLASFERSTSSVSLDSCWIAANAGRDTKRPRRLTRARDAARRVVGKGAAATTLAIYCCLAGGGLLG